MSDRPAPDGDPAPLELLPIPAPSAVPARARAERGVEATDALGRYMAELRLHAPISREEEQALAVRWRDQGDLEAARSLVLANLRLVVKIALEYRRSWTNLLDLIQEGNVGLMQAVQRFDPEQGVKLSSYAAYWIRAYILKHLIDNIRMVRLGSTRAERKLFFRLNKEKRELERQGFEAEPKLLAERLDVTEQDVLSMEQRLAEGEVSFDAPLLGEDSDRTLGDLVSAGAASAEDELGNRELRRVFVSKVKEFAEGLEPRERQIVEQRILAEEPRTLQELGDEFGVTRERVRQLEARLVKRLREHLQREVVDFEYYAPEE